VKSGDVSVGAGTGNGGTYVGTVTAPTVSGSYPIDVTLTADSGQKTVKTAADTVTVTEPQVSFENVKIQTSANKASFTFDVAGDSDNIAKFKFVYGTDSGALTQESVTFDKKKILANASGSTASGATASGTYQWYVAGLQELKPYYFQIKALDAAGSEISNVVSDILVADLSLNAAGKCTIANVSGLKVAKADDQSTLSWDAIPDALSYNVYKKDATGNFVLVENVKTNQYVIHLAKDSVKYEDFAVKAVCSDGTTESADYANATHVQTGPAQVIVFLALALGIGYFVTRRKFAFFKG
jgi:hypothetical protein